jgi:tagatose-1,6-bisphosphate aldolase non-catalytic subunit AgaZ/GatZ
VQQALENGSPLLVESTCNQVNQEGGYTGMTPADFRDYVQELVDRSGLPRERLILDGDHLGPGPWQHEPIESAMASARVLVRDCAAGRRSPKQVQSLHSRQDPACACRLWPCLWIQLRSDKQMQLTIGRPWMARNDALGRALASPRHTRW